METMGRTVGLLPAAEMPTVRVEAGIEDFYILMWLSLILFVLNWGTRLIIVEPLCRAFLNPVKKDVQKTMIEEGKNLEIARERVPASSLNNNHHHRPPAAATKLRRLTLLFFNSISARGRKGRVASNETQSPSREVTIKTFSFLLFASGPHSGPHPGPHP